MIGGMRGGEENGDVWGGSGKLKGFRGGEGAWAISGFDVLVGW